MRVVSVSVLNSEFSFLEVFISLIFLYKLPESIKSNTTFVSCTDIHVQYRNSDVLLYNIEEEYNANIRWDQVIVTLCFRQELVKIPTT